MTYGLSHRDLAAILNTLRTFPEIEEAILFGSRAKGNYKPGSDVDIAVKGKGIESSCVADLSYALNEESTLPYFFDIVHFEHISERELVDHINRVGILLYRNQGVF